MHRSINVKNTRSKQKVFNENINAKSGNYNPVTPIFSGFSEDFSKKINPSQSSKQNQKDNFLNNDVSFEDTNQKFSFLDLKVRAKISIIEYLKKQFKINQFNQEILNSLENIANSTTIAEVFEISYKTIQNTVQQRQKQTKSTVFKADADEKNKKIQKEYVKLSTINDKSDKKKSKSKSPRVKFNYQQQTLSLKRQIAVLQENNKKLEKQILTLIQDFQVKKKFYLAEINKLTNIIKTSIVDVHQLMQVKTKQAVELQNKMEEHKNKGYFERYGSDGRQTNSKINQEINKQARTESNYKNTQQYQIRTIPSQKDNQKNKYNNQIKSDYYNYQS